jgi:hypothetical protein
MRDGKRRRGRREKEGRGEREDEDGSQVHFSLLVLPSRVRPPLLLSTPLELP